MPRRHPPRAPSRRRMEVTLADVTWTARQVGYRILCGHQVDGRYDCGGELARVISGWHSMPDGTSSPDDLSTMLDLSTLGVVSLGEGFVEDPPGSAHWRRTNRAERQLEAGDTPRSRRSMGSWGSPPTRSYPDWPGTPPEYAHPAPWTRECPRCGRTAIVQFALLWTTETGSNDVGSPAITATGRIVVRGSSGRRGRRRRRAS